MSAGLSTGSASASSPSTASSSSRVRLTHWAEEALVRRRYTIAADAVNRDVAASLNRLYHRTVPFEPEAIVENVLVESMARAPPGGDDSRESTTAMELRDCARGMRLSVKQLTMFVTREKRRREATHAVLTDSVDRARVPEIRAAIAQLDRESDAVSASRLLVCPRPRPAALLFSQCPTHSHRPHLSCSLDSPFPSPSVQVFAALADLLLTLRSCSSALLHAPSDLAELELELASQLRQSIARTSSDAKGDAIRNRARPALLSIVVQIRDSLAKLLPSFQPQQLAVLSAQEAEDLTLGRLIALLPPTTPPLAPGDVAASVAAGPSSGQREFIV